MNEVQYKIENYIYKKFNSTQSVSEKFIIKQYQYLNETATNFTGLNLDITKVQFEQLIRELYEVLKLKVYIEEFYKIVEHYMNLVLMDCIVQNIPLDLCHCLEQVWYFRTYEDKDCVKRYNEDLPYLQNKLYQKFKIQETLSEQIKRKVKIRVLSKVE